MGLYIPLNDGSVPCIAIGSQQFSTTHPPTEQILAADFLYGYPAQLRYQGTVGTYFCALFGTGDTAPVQYWFNTTTISGFTTFLSGASVTNSYATYAGLNGVGTQNIFNPTISVLVNPLAAQSQGYYDKSNITTFQITPNSKNYPQYQLYFTGNPQTGNASATASLAVPIAAVTQAVASTGTASTIVGTPAAGDTLTITVDSVPFVYTVIAGDTAAAIFAKVLTLLQNNVQNNTVTGVNSTGTLTYTFTNTLAAGATYNGKTITVSDVGATFGTDVGSTTAGGVTQTGLGNTITAFITPPSSAPIQIGVVSVVAGSTQSTLKTAVDALFNSNTLGFTFVGTLATNVDTLAGTAPSSGSYYNGFKVSFTPTGTTFGTNPVSATFTGGV